MKRSAIVIITLFMISACQKGERERLFEMVYPPVDFVIPAGLSASLPRVFEKDDLPSNIGFYLSERELSAEAIRSLDPFRARIVSLDNGFDYNFVEEISVRICPARSQQCSPAEEAFYIDDLRARAGEQIELLPTLRNQKNVLTDDRFRLEIIFFLNSTSPFSVRSRFEMSFEAVR